MSGFLPSKQVINAEADQPWMKSDTDKMLDEFFAGASPSRLAQALKRNPKAIKRRLEQFFYNEFDRAADYQPVRRISRAGKRWTQNEVLFRKAAAKRKVSAKSVATVLARTEKEVSGVLYELEGKDTANISKAKQLAPTMDLIWAYRYAYFVWGKQTAGIVSNSAYDDLVKEEIEFGGGEAAFEGIKKHQGWPNYIISLALYLSSKAKWEPPK